MMSDLERGFLKVFTIIYYPNAPLVDRRIATNPLIHSHYMNQ